MESAAISISVSIDAGVVPLVAAAMIEIITQRKTVRHEVAHHEQGGRSFRSVSRPVPDLSRHCW
jgi:hypothetical protein